MRYTTRTRLKKLVYIAIAIIAFVALNFWLFTKVFRRTTPIEKSAVLIASGENAAAYPYDDGVITVTDSQIICYDYKGNKLFTSVLPLENMKAYRNGDITVCWYANVAVILNKSGEILLKLELDGQILTAASNSSQFAVAIIEEEQSWIRVFDLTGTEVAADLKPDMSILDIGYFGEKDIQLWTLLLDYHATLPITRIETNHPGNSQTGLIKIFNQVGYEVVPIKNLVYIIGTQHIQARTYTNVKKSEILINGWTLQDSIVNDNDEVKFLLAPVDTTGLNVPLSALWYITPSGVQYRISMPSGIKKAVMTEKKIYAISSNGIYAMNFNGEKRKFSKLPFIIDEIIGRCEGRAVIVKSSDNYFIIALN